LKGIRLIDDTYNANPDSVRAAIDVLACAGGMAVLVLGDMGEVGEHGPLWHAEVGTYARERGVAALVALGDATRETVRAFGPAARHFNSLPDLVTELQSLIQPGMVVLVKGSRFMRMERVVTHLESEELR
jgi:UDP-N-acetylmuramoyl-tripeptide--D-alanyl-D-alanine ligase